MPLTSEHGGEMRLVGRGCQFRELPCHGGLQPPGPARPIQIETPGSAWSCSRVRRGISMSAIPLPRLPRRCHRRRQHVLDLEHYLDVLSHKPGAFAGSKPLAQWREAGRWPACYDELWDAAAGAARQAERHPRHGGGAGARAGSSAMTGCGPRSPRRCRSAPATWRRCAIC